MIGPSQERVTIESLGELVTSRSPRAHLVYGEAGIGKTWLLRGLREWLDSAGWRVLLVTGCAAGGAVPLGGFLSLFGAGEDLTPGAVIQMLAGQRSKLVLLVDDVDGLDEASQFVVAHLVRETRLRVVLSGRGFDVMPDAFIELYDAGDLLPVEVGPLTEGESLKMAGELLGARLTPAAEATLLSRAGGNALLLRELVLGSRQAGVLVSGEHGWEFREAPVASVRLADLVGVHLGHLSSWARGRARVLAAGGPLAVKVLDSRAVDELDEAGLLQVDSDDMAGLDNPLYADALRASAGDEQWRDACREAARLARESGAVCPEPIRRELELRATRLSLTAGEPPSIESALELAQHSHGLHQHVLVARLAEQMLGQQPDHPEGRRLAGLAASALGQDDAAVEILTATEDDEPATRLALARARAEHLGTRGQDARAAAATLRAALDVAPPDGIERSRAEQDLVRWQYAGALQEVLPPVESGGDETSRVQALVIAAMTGCLTGPLSQAQRYLGELRRMMPGTFPAWPAAPDLVRVAETMAMSYDGDVVATREHARAELDRATRERPEMVGTWQYTLGVLEFFAADAATAHEHAEKAIQNLAWRDPMGLAPAAGALAVGTSVALGRPSDADRHRCALPESVLIDPKVAMLLAWAEAHEQWRSGQLSAATQILLEAAKSLLEWRHVFFAGMIAHCVARIGDPEAALTILEPASEAAGGGLLTMFCSHARAIASGDPAVLAEIAERLEELGEVGAAADTAVVLAQWYAAAGNPVRARRWELWSRQVLETAPATTTWGERPPADQLTGRELEVARLAAARLSAQEIAERLDKSPNTVTNQLASAYRKLGVNSRRELAELFDVER